MERLDNLEGLSSIMRKIPLPRLKAAVTVDSIIPPITLPRFHWALNRHRERRALYPKHH